MTEIGTDSEDKILATLLHCSGKLAAVEGLAAADTVTVYLRPPRAELSGPGLDGEPVTLLAAAVPPDLGRAVAAFVEAALSKTRDSAHVAALLEADKISLAVKVCRDEGRVQLLLDDGRGERPLVTVKLVREERVH